MKLKTILLATVLFMEQANAFSQTDPLIKYLPDNASMVISLNILQLGHKISGESFRQSSLYREMMKDPNPELTSFLEDPSSLGIDLSHDLFLVTAADASPEDHPGTAIHIFGLLKDETLFTNTMKKLLSDKDSIAVYGTNHILFTKNGGLTLAWNKEIFVLNAGNNKSMIKDVYQATGDTGMADFDKKMKEAMTLVQKKQRDLCFELLTPHPGNLFSSNPHFISLVNTAGDIKMWSDGTPSPALNKILPIARLTKSLQAFTGKNKTGILNFENGKIVIQTRNYPEEPMAAVYKKYPVNPLNMDLTRRLPKGKLLAMMNLSYNPEMAKEMMQQSGMREMTDSLKKVLPFDFDGTNAAFKNNILLAVVKADDISPDDSITQKMDGIEVILAIPIADKAKFLELKANASRGLDSLKNSDMGSKMLKGFHPGIRYNDSLLVVSSSPVAALAFLNNTGTNTVPDWLRSNTHHPMLMSINLKELMGLAMGKRSPGKKGKDEQKMLEMFDQFIVYGGDYENESVNSTMEFRFTNQTDNSLKQLFDMISLVTEEKGKAIIEERKDQKIEDLKVEKIEPVKEKDVPLPPPPPKKPVTRSKTNGHH